MHDLIAELDRYGPGAVGVGWDLPIAALASFIVGDELPKGDELMADPQTTDFMRHSATAGARFRRSIRAPTRHPASPDEDGVRRTS